MLHKLNCRCFDELSRLRGPKPVTLALQGRCTVNRVRFFRVFFRVGALPELRSLVLENHTAKGFDADRWIFVNAFEVVEHMVFNWAIFPGQNKATNGCLKS